MARDTRCHVVVDNLPAHDAPQAIGTQQQGRFKGLILHRIDTRGLFVLRDVDDARVEMQVRATLGTHRFQQQGVHVGSRNGDVGRAIALHRRLA